MSVLGDIAQFITGRSILVPWQVYDKINILNTKAERIDFHPRQVVDRDSNPQLDAEEYIFLMF